MKLVHVAKDFITEAVRHSWKMNDYVGPVNHGAYHRYGAGAKLHNKKKSSRYPLVAGCLELDNEKR